MRDEDRDAIRRAALLDTIENLVKRRAEYDSQIRLLVKAACADHIKWKEIGEALGTSTQAAWEKYRPAEPPKINGKQA